MQRGAFGGCLFKPIQYLPQCCAAVIQCDHGTVEIVGDRRTGQLIQNAVFFKISPAAAPRGTVGIAGAKRQQGGAAVGHLVSFAIPGKSGAFVEIVYGGGIGRTIAQVDSAQQFDAVAVVIQIIQPLKAQFFRGIFANGNKADLGGGDIGPIAILGDDLAVQPYGRFFFTGVQHRILLR